MYQRRPKSSAAVESRLFFTVSTSLKQPAIIMKVLAVVLLAVCAASAATVEHVVKVPHHTAFVQPTPYVGSYVAPYHHVGVAPVVTKVVDGKPVVTTYTAGAYPVPVGGYAYPYVHSPVAYSAYPYGTPVHTVPVVPKVEKVE